MTDIGEKTNSGNAADDCIKKSVGDPVEVSTGKVHDSKLDVSFKGPLSIRLMRSYSSELVNRKGIFGFGWTSLFDSKIMGIFHGKIIFENAAGKESAYPDVDEKEAYFCESDRVTVRRQGQTLHITNSQHITYSYNVNTLESESRLIGISDKYNNKITIEHESKSLLKLQDSFGIEYTLKFNDNSFLSSITAYSYPDKIQKKLRRYQYNNYGLLTAVFDEDDFAERYEYDSKKRLVMAANKNGHPYFYEYDNQGRCSKAYGEDNMYYRQFSYDSSKGSTQVGNVRGETTQYRCNSEGLPTMVTYPSGGVKFFYYDANHNLIGSVDENTNPVTYEYDESRVARIIDQEGNFVTIDYGENYIEETDPLGNTHKRITDDQGNLVAVIDAKGNSRTYKYNEKGELTKAVNELGQTISYEQDYKNRQVKITGKNGAVTTLKYNQWGVVGSEEDPLGNKTVYQYDNKLRIISVALNNGVLYRYKYDPEDNPVAIKNSLGHEHRFEYNSINKIVCRIDPYGNKIEAVYDTEGRVSQIINENSQSYRVVYDNMGRPVQETDFDNTSRTYEYDLMGNMIKIKEPDGRVIHIDYGKKGQIIKIHGGKSASRAFDIDFKYNKNAMMIEASNKDCVVKLEYNELGRVIKEWQNDYCVERDYDAAGNLISVKNPWGSVTHFVNDELNRLAQIDLDGNCMVKAEYDSINNQALTQWPGNISTRHTYDKLGQLIRHGIFKGEDQCSDRLYSYNSESLLTRIVDYHANTHGEKRFNYRYDKNYQVTSCITESGHADFNYDNAGNMVSFGTKAGSYSPGNRQLEFKGIRYEYDLKGNLVSGSDKQGSFTYQYDIFNRLIRFTGADNLVSEYTYDPFGRRIGKTLPDGKKIRFAWDADKMIGEEHGENKVEYVMHPNHHIPIFIKTDEGVFSVHSGHTGTVLKITDDNGNMVWNSEYDTLGNCQVSGHNNFKCNLRYPGQYFDEETGLHYNLHRYYNPETGRYLTPDPLGFAGGDIHLYRYAKNNPVNWIDPTGLFHCKKTKNCKFGHHTISSKKLDYTKEDHSISTNPLTPWGINNHFQSMEEVEKSLSEIKGCNLDKFQRVMHRGQDTFSHYNKGYRGHGWQFLQFAVIAAYWVPAAGIIAGGALAASAVMHMAAGRFNPKFWLPGHAGANLTGEDPDADRAAYDKAENWTKGKEEEFCKKCPSCCPK